MKKCKLFGWALIALASIISCTNDTEVLTQGNEIKLTSEIIPSRVTSLDYQSTQIVEGQQIGVTITGAKSEHKNVAWTAGEDGDLNNTSTPIYWSNTEATIYAYHPYNSSWSGTDKLESFSVNTDQSTDAGYLNSDLLWATKTGTKTSNPIELSFVHKLAKINVTLTSTDIADLSGATISICGTKISTSFNPITGELSSANNVANIKAGVTTTEAYTASAIIIPQTITGGTQLIKVTHNNKNFYYKLSTDKEFKSGYSYSYTLKVKEKQVEVDLESGNITDWTDEDATTGDVNEVATIPYLTFVAEENQTLTMSKAVKTLEYSHDGDTWNKLSTNTVEFGGSKGTLLLRGKSLIGTNGSSIRFGDKNVKVSCTGDIRTLVDYENYNTTNTANACFSSLFYRQHVLITAPKLPATTLAKKCYENMFSWTGLTNAPELPATTLADSCYAGMFMDCKNLIETPLLPAMTLTEACYSYMFIGCTSLKHAPELPATTLATGCYTGMFQETSISIAPQLPATTLAEGCYSGMFANCTNLTNAPELPAITLAESCYSEMFLGCTNLKEAPQLPATILSKYCYSQMFKGCTSLESAPDLPSLELKSHCYISMFSGCTNLNKAPILAAPKLADYCYLQMFYDCKKLNKITMLATDVSATMCLNGWLYGITTSGTLITAEDMEQTLKENNAIPYTWFVETYEE